MECPNCKTVTLNLVCSIEGLKCSSCYKPQNNNPLLHQVLRHKDGVRLTHADAMRIKTNKKRADGTYKPDPRWR